MEIMGYVLMFGSMLIPSIAIKIRYTRGSLIAGLIATLIIAYIGVELV